MVSKHRGLVGAQAPEGPSPSAHTTQLGVDSSTTQYTPHRLTPSTTVHAPSLARSRQQDATPSLSSITLSLPSLFSRSCHLVGGDSSWLAFPLSSDLCSSSPLEGHCCSPRRLPPSRSAPRRRTPPLARAAQRTVSPPGALLLASPPAAIAAGASSSSVSPCAAGRIELDPSTSSTRRKFSSRPRRR